MTKNLAIGNKTGMIKHHHLDGFELFTTFDFEDNLLVITVSNKSVRENELFVEKNSRRGFQLTDIDRLRDITFKLVNATDSKMYLFSPVDPHGFCARHDYIQLDISDKAYMFHGLLGLYEPIEEGSYVMFNLDSITSKSLFNIAMHRFIEDKFGS